MTAPAAHFDAIVIGTGGIGSAALNELAWRGARVLGLDRFGPAHEYGSSHGQSRLIRQAYFEHPDYVPLVRRAYEGWDELSARAKVPLLRKIGLLQVGPATGEVVSGVLRSAREHQLTVEELSPHEATTRWPGFRIEDSDRAVYEPGAGWLPVERCVQAYLDDAVCAGAQLQTNEPVVGWQVTGSTVKVTTERAEYEADRLIVTAGAWAGRLLQDLRLPLVVRRKPQFWFAPRSDVYRFDRPCPAFLFETAGGVFYGLPQLYERELKVAEHSGGQVVDDPATVDRTLDPADLARVTDFLVRHLPEVEPRLLEQRVCLYTLTPDQTFIVDSHPEWPAVVFAAGLSGHGFKFAPVLGQVLADLALQGRTAWPIEFLRLARPALAGNRG